MKALLGVVSYSFSPSTQKEDLCEFKTNLAYVANFRPVRAT